MEFENNLGKVIEESGVRKGFICEKLNITYKTLKKWIDGITFPNAIEIIILCEILHCSFGDLYKRKTT